jgi:hydroxypyruvate reductase
MLATEAGDLRGLLRRAFEAAVDAARPERVLAGHLPRLSSGRLIVVGAGKAAAAMARVVERHYADAAPALDLSGLVVTRYGHAVDTERIAVREAGHPVPDLAGVEATAELLATLEDAEEGDTVLCLISGGGSALLCAPRGLDLDGKRSLTDALLRSGASIDDMNAVRKHLSAVKGGQLARTAHPAAVVTLLISDVVGDDPSVIASGPTVPDPSSYRDALAVLDRYTIDAPEARAHLQRGAEGRVAETPKPGDPVFERSRAVTVASNQQSLEAAAAVLQEAGFPAHILSATIEGEAREAGRLHAAIARQIAERGQPFDAPCALLSGGETTVTVRGRGRGGRNQEFALGLALDLSPDLRVYALAADTDGLDGSEHNAGAFVTPTLVAEGLEGAAHALDRNDSHAVFAEADHLLVTGPTHTNVNDLRIVVVLPR